MMEGAAGGARPNFSRSAITRYVQLAALFRRRIETGEWPLGSQVPTVDELAAECGVARATIRQAMGILEEEKIIERFRAKGTFVTKNVRDDIWCTIQTNWSRLLRPAADDATIELLTREVKDVKLPISHRIGKPVQSYSLIRRRHNRAGRAFLVANLYIATTLRKQITRRDLVSKTALKLVSDVLGSEIGDAEHTMTVGLADLIVAEQLAIPVNAAVAFVRREVIDTNGNLVLVSDAVYRGDVVKVSVKLRWTDSPDEDQDLQI